MFIIDFGEIASATCVGSNETTTSSRLKKKDDEEISENVAGDRAPYYITMLELI